jgi:hypothetical protein
MYTFLLAFVTFTSGRAFHRCWLASHLARCTKSWSVLRVRVAGELLTAPFSEGFVEKRRLPAACSLLFIGTSMRSGVLVHPVLLFIGHAVAPSHLARGAGLVAEARQRSVTERFCPVAPPVGVPLVDDHFHRAQPQMQLLHFEA